MKTGNGMASDAVRALDVLAHAVEKLPRGATLQLTITSNDLRQDIQSIWKNRRVQPDGSVCYGTTSLVFSIRGDNDYNRNQKATFGRIYLCRMCSRVKMLSKRI
jgi:hypothetical protein